MDRVFLSRFAIVFCCALLSILLASILLPTWQGNLFGGAATLDINPAFLGSSRVVVPENQWGWSVFMPLPVSAELKIVKMKSIYPGSPWPLISFVLLIFPLLAAPAAILGLLKKNIKLALVIFVSSATMLVVGFLFAAGSLWLFGPNSENSESETVLAIMDDFYRPVVKEPYFIPGQELVVPWSPYYGGKLICNQNSCRLVARR